MIRSLNHIAWLACVIYSSIPSFWLLIHPRVDYWRSRKQPYSVLVPLWIGMWAVIAAFTFHWRNLQLYHSPWIWLAALILFATGVYLYKRAGHQFTPAQLGGIPEIQANHRDQRLVTTGIRARTRHPVYLGHLCEMLAWSLGSGLLVNFGLTAFAVLTGAMMIRMEDRELERRFGDEYRRYRRQVPSVLPAWRNP
jgi:protein-S-isoprenylcysteine O-methyltransferase Ste14